MSRVCSFREPTVTKLSDLNEALWRCRGALGVCVVFSFAINLLMLASPIYMLQVYDRVLTTAHVETLVMITLIVSVAIAVMCALDALRTAVTIRIGCWLNERLGPIYLACGVRARLQGDASGAQSLRDISQIQNFVATQGLTAFFDSPWVPLFIALICMLHPLLGAVSLAAAVLLLALSVANEFGIRGKTQAANATQIDATLLAEAAIRNAEIVRAMGMLPALTARWVSLNNAVMDGLRSGGDIGGIILAATKFVRYFVQIAILGVGAWLVLKAELTSGGMIAASILLGRALAPVELAMGAWRNFMAARFAYQRLKKMIESFPAQPRRTRLPPPSGRLVVDDITYIAPNTGHLILSKLSFSVDPGEALAIVGPSGAGKSTLCRLLVAVEKPSVGEIRLDGSQLHNWDPGQLSHYVGFLPQDVELFRGTVRENIARMKDATDDVILKAAMVAHAHEMIQHLPQGYDTRIGDGGIRLSGGQRQRIGLARAVFGVPRLIILDEPNANLDHAGETALGAALYSLKRCGAALVIVGHRPSTLAHADKVLALKEGCAAMYGPCGEILHAIGGGSAHTSDQGEPVKRPRPEPLVRGTINNSAPRTTQPASEGAL